jgi:hypothetical protein
MKRLTLTICAAMFLLYACNNASDNTTTKDSSSNASAENKEKEWVPIDTSKIWPAMMEYGKVGEPQQMLAKSNGNWTGEVVMWYMPDMKPDTSMTTVTNKMIMGNRYQVSTYSGNMMGMPFEGQSTTGFDNAKKVYMSTWIDDMSSGIMQMEGPWDEASKTVSLKGTFVNPVDNRECNIRQTYRFVDDNTEIMEMYGPDPMTGKEFKTMQITLKRKN